MNISLRSFLETGILGKLRLGLSAEEVLHLLGPPDDGDVTLQDSGTGSLWQYGTFLLDFGEVDNQFEELASIKWMPDVGEPVLLPGCILEDWQITAEMTLSEVKTYLRATGLKFRYRSRKGYCERQPVPASWRQRWPNVDEAQMAQHCWALTFRKPKNDADIVGAMDFFSIFLLSGIRMAFVDGRLIDITLSR
jgi:hypothetical protein